MSQILVIEDNPANLKLMRILLEYCGYEVIAALDGKKGIEMAKDFLPDLIIMDIQLPVMNGIECFTLLHKDSITQNIPVIAATSFAMKGDKEKLLEMGFIAYISKPFHNDQFLQMVKEHLH